MRTITVPALALALVGCAVADERGPSNRVEKAPVAAYSNHCDKNTVCENPKKRTVGRSGKPTLVCQESTEPPELPQRLPVGAKGTWAYPEVYEIGTYHPPIAPHVQRVGTTLRDDRKRYRPKLVRSGSGR